MSPAVTTAPRRQVSSRMINGASCTLEARAQLFSLGGGVMLAVCLLFTALAGGTAGERPAPTLVSVVFGLLALAAWAYLADGASERLGLYGETLVHTSLFGGQMSIPLSAIQSLMLVHEGLNQQIGIESIRARYTDGRVERLALGSCWRRRDLELFLSSVEKALGKAKLLEEVR